MIVAFAGGVGGARLARGLIDVLVPDELIIAVNTGDDFEHLGLHISPDLDTVMYTLAGINDPVQGWGIAGETWSFMQALEQLGGETWFRLGDHDLATHIERTRLLRERETLSEITQRLCAKLGVRHRVVPMSDQAVRTIVHTSVGALAFQDYFVRRRAEPALTQVQFAGAEDAAMSPILRRAFDNPQLDAVIIAPSNPYLSIAPILAVPGMRAALEQRRCPAIAVSPIVAGHAIKGPAAKIMRELGVEASALTIAQFYRGLIDALVLDHADEDLRDPIEALGIRTIFTDTVMKDISLQTALAQTVVDLALSQSSGTKR
jgi:LPPG:FO 2-phospho-L-lactate transferase